MKKILSHGCQGMDWCVPKWREKGLWWAHWHGLGIRLSPLWENFEDFPCPAPLWPLLTLMPTPQLLQRECSQPRGSAIGPAKSLLTIITFHLLFQLALFSSPLSTCIVPQNQLLAEVFLFSHSSHKKNVQTNSKVSYFFLFILEQLGENWMADIITKRKFENNLGHSGAPFKRGQPFHFFPSWCWRGLCLLERKTKKQLG